MCDELSSLDWAVALHQLLEILNDVSKKVKKSVSNLIKSQLQQWFAGRPSYIKVTRLIYAAKVELKKGDRYLMAIYKELNFLINGKEHELTFSQTVFTGKRELEVDGIPVKVKKAGVRDMFCETEYPLVVDGNNLSIIIRGARVDVILDGKSVITGKEFIPIPKWSWIFVAACLGILVISGGGAVPGAISFIGATTCISITKLSKINTLFKIILCIAVTVICWGLVVFMVSLFI